MNRKTILSSCRQYRYTLWREFGDTAKDSRYVVFVGLNPSFADESTDDRTVRRCIQFAKDWGYPALCIVNLFAFRTPKPYDMMQATDPIGPDNDQHLQNLCAKADLVVAAWGNGGVFRDRSTHVRALLPAPRCLGLNKSGQPKHPLYVRAATTPQLW